jgi:hypothetical protein
MSSCLQRDRKRMKFHIRSIAPFYLRYVSVCCAEITGAAERELSSQLPSGQCTA